MSMADFWTVSRIGLSPVSPACEGQSRTPGICWDGSRARSCARFKGSTISPGITRCGGTWPSRRVNPYRLTEHCHRLLRDNPLDKDALWALVAVNLANGSDRFPEDSWQSLLLAEESFDPDWLIFAGLLWSTAVGDESVDALAQFLLRNGLCERVMPVLKSLESGENKYARVALDEFYVHDHVIDWARKVKECCEEARK